jgi:glucose-1-phosphate thymidylyltransferase
VKALVLAGGSGTRLRPITHTSAKQLVPVANKPVLFYGLEAIRDAGITAVGMVVGDTEPEIRSAVGSGREFGLDVTYIQQSSPLGLAHAVLMAREFLGEDDFVSTWATTSSWAVLPRSCRSSGSPGPTRTSC